jgi:hypothetical protein
MALTLMEASKLNPGEVKRNAIIEMFARNSDILNAMPFAEVKGMALSYTQEGTLPTNAFRGVNEGYVGNTGVLNPQVEVLRIAGGDLDVDRTLVKTLGEEVRAQQESSKVRSLSLSIARNFIQGDSSLNPKAFDGLRVRTVGNQLIANGSTAGGDALSLAKLDEAIDQVIMPNGIMCSKAHRRRLSRAAANTAVGGYIAWAKNEFGERIGMYNDLPLLIADEDETGARIIDFNEANPAGGATVGSSMYVTAIGDGLLTGIQNGGIEVRDLGELQTIPVYRTRVEWVVGMVAMHGRSAARIWGIKDAPVTL